MGYNRAGYQAKMKLRRRRKDERRLALKAAPAKPAQPAAGPVAKVKAAVTTAAAVAKGVVQGVKEGLASKRPAKAAE